MLESTVSVLTPQDRFSGHTAAANISAVHHLYKEHTSTPQVTRIKQQIQGGTTPTQAQ